MSEFIVLEGIDGSGKTTQLKRLSKTLAAEGKAVVETAEPTDGEIGRLLRSVLRRELDVSPLTIAPLFTADRLDHITQVNAAIAEGKTVLCDRYALSSLAYQSDEYPLDWLYELNRPALERCRPSLTVYLDVTPETAMSRITARGETPELFERLDRLKKTRRAYLDAIECLRSHGMRIEIIDGGRGEDEIARELYALCGKF